jgi:type II secretory ATPase GspE/PulE/Tfp pilus assembly ATPase PilB-like protein
MHNGALLAALEVGNYISIWKTILFLLIMLGWARFMTWADKDSVAARMPRAAINTGLMVAGVIGLALFFLVGGFFVALALLLVMMLISGGVYLGLRHSKVGLGDLGDQFNEWIRGFTSRKKEIVLAPGEVQVLGRGGPLPVPEGDSPERPAYDTVQTLLTDPMKRNMERLDLAPTDGVAGMKYYVDGVAYSGGEINKANAGAAVGYLKRAAGLNLEEKRKPQTGTLKLMIDGKRREVQIITAGSTSGEQMRLIVDPKARHSLGLEQLGMPPRQLETVKDVIAENEGVVLVSAPKGQGLTSLLYGILRGHDAFMTHIHTIERSPDQDLEGITQNRLPSNASPSDEAQMVDWVSSQQPDIILINQVEDPRSARRLVNFGSEGKRVYIGMRTGNTFETLEYWRKLVGDDRQALKSLRMIISGRLVRRLCAACKVQYSPDPMMLRKLNMDPERASKLFQARVDPLRDPKGRPIPCEFCHDLRFKGRIGVYEIFLIDDEVREAVSSGASANQLKALFRKQRSRYLQEQALALVEAGETSVQEVLRVLRGGGESQPAAA